ncbi:MAG: hypothetical protein ACPGN3_01560 [Opitutales bacterium]
MRSLLATLFAIAAFPMAVALLFLGSAIPGQRSGISPARLTFVGAQGPSLIDEAEALLARGKPGPARFLTLASDAIHSSALLDSIDKRLEDDPFLKIAGGRDPYFSELSDLLKNQSQPIPGKASAANFIVFGPARESLSRMLSYSENDWVQRILSGRTITGLPHLPPSDSAAGAPMETALLISALLTQSEAIPSKLSIELANWIDRAKQRDVTILPILDRALIDTLGLAQRMDWETLKTVFGRSESWDSISWLNAALRAPDTDTGTNAEIISAWLTVASTEAFRTYIATHPSQGWNDVSTSLRRGIDSLDLLIQEDRPVYQPPEWLANIYPSAARNVETLSLDWTTGKYSKLSTLRFSLFALAGLVVSASLIFFLKVADQLEIQATKATLASGTTAAIFTLISWALTEPSLLESTQSSTPEIRFNAGPGALMGSLKAAAMNPGSIDQVTLLVLGVFLLIQIIIYLVCLVRVSDINKQPVSPSLKIALLENEDSLFDTGLYVGLGGTVLSLILVTLGIVEASIMAAYASTLFGIIFVAALKIFHVRPLRRSLIIQNERPL